MFSISIFTFDSRYMLDLAVQSLQYKDLYLIERNWNFCCYEHLFSRCPPIFQLFYFQFPHSNVLQILFFPPRTML